MSATCAAAVLQTTVCAVGFARPVDRTWQRPHWRPLLELDVRGAYACLVLTMLPKRAPHVRKNPRPFLEWEQQRAQDGNWRWSVIFGEAAHEAARPCSMLWWRLLHHRWMSNERACRWMPGLQSAACSLCGEASGSTAHVFVECRDACAVWGWLCELWRRITDGGELRVDARAVLSGFALPRVREWQPLRRLRLALFSECLGAIAAAHSVARHVQLLRGQHVHLRRELRPLARARHDVRARVRREFEAACVKGSRALATFEQGWQVRGVLCAVRRERGGRATIELRV